MKYKESIFEQISEFLEYLGKNGYNEKTREKTNLIEKLHCIMIYYCIRDFLEGIGEIKICEDVNFRRIKNLLPLLFKNNNYLNGIDEYASSCQNLVVV